MKKIVRLTESQLIDVVKKVINEQQTLGEIIDKILSSKVSSRIHIGLIPKGRNNYEFEGYNFTTDLPISLTFNDIDDAYVESDKLVVQSGRDKYIIDRNKKLTTAKAW